MATHDYSLANQSGASFRADLNNCLSAVLSNNSNSTAPSTTVAYMLWADSSNGILKIRNSANNAWVELFQLDGTLTMEDGTVSAPGLAFRDDLDTGIWSSAADTFNIATGGAERLELGTGATVFNEGGNDVDFRIEGDGDANLFYIDAGNDRIGISTATPDTLLHLESTNSPSSIGNAIRISDADTAVVADQVCGRIEFETADSGNPGVNCQIDNVYSGSGGGGELQFRTGFAGSLVDSVRVDDTGRVGIIQSNPVYRLDIGDGSTDPASGYQVRVNSSGDYIVAFQRQSTPSFSIRNNSTSSVFLNTQNNKALILGVSSGNASGSIEEDVKIDSTGDLTISDGDLVIGTAGHGIDFSAQTQSTSTTDDEILDHYEKGQWTPVLKKNGGDNAHASNGGTPTVIGGRYIRVGKLVWLSCYISWTSGSNSELTSGGWTLHGLPFSLQDDDPSTCRIYQFCSLGYFTIDSTAYVHGHDNRWQCNVNTYFDLYTDVSSADLSWTTGTMSMSMTGTFMLHE
jgi:hypothetical protein